MAKQVIVVVHGVGVKQAGVSSDLLAAALQDDDGKSDRTRLPPHSSDDFVLLESPRYDSSGKASTFPARVRRYRSYDEKGIVKEERVIADFFWGDVTAFGSSIVNVVLAYFKVAMGLSHAIRENASDVYPEDNWEDRCIRRLARGAALTIHGPIIALNIVMLPGLLLAALLALRCALASSTCRPDILLRVQIAVVGLLAIAAGLLVLWQGRGAFLYRHLMSWIVLSGLAFLLLGSPELFGFADSKAVASIESWLVGLESGMRLEDFKRTYPGLLGVGWRMLALMSASWIVVFVQVILVWILGLIRLKRVGMPRAPNLIVPALSLMSLLWFLLIAALWAAVLKLPSSYNLDLKREAVAGALVAIGAALIVLILLAVAAGWVFRLKSELKRAKFSDPAAYMADSGANADAYANRFRLLIASWMLRALSIFLPLVLATFYFGPFFVGPGSWLGKLDYHDHLRNSGRRFTVRLFAKSGIFRRARHTRRCARLSEQQFLDVRRCRRSLQDRRATAANLAGTIALQEQGQPCNQCKSARLLGCVVASTTGSTCSFET